MVDYKPNDVVNVHFIENVTVNNEILYKEDCYYKCSVIKQFDLYYIAITIMEMPNYGDQVIAEIKGDEIVFEFNREIPTVEVDEAW